MSDGTIFLKHSKWYLLVFFNLLFIAALVYTFVLTTFDHKCVFPAKKMCYTDLINEVKNQGIYFREFNQKRKNEVDFSSFSLLNNETINFQYYRQNNNKQKTEDFKLVLNYTGDPTGVSGGVCWPLHHGTSSGYALFGTSHGDYGVSIYIGGYTTGGGSTWDSSYKVINEGLGELIKQKINSGGSFNATIATIPYGFDYITGVYGSEGAAKIESTAEGEESYFPQFKNAKVINLRSENADKHPYNPFNDFYNYKKKRQWSRIPEITEIASGASVLHSCIDPGARELPSCRSPYIDGKGYAYQDKTSIKYSVNCSNNLKHIKVDPKAPSSRAHNVGQLILPNNSASFGLWNNTDEGSDDRNKLIKGIEIGNESFEAVTGVAPDNDTVAYLYVGNRIFCGKGGVTGKGTSPMYGVSQSDSDIGKLFEGSTVPNVESPVNNLYTLGFN